MRIVLLAAVLAAFSCSARAQNTFPTPGGGTVPGVVLMCDSGNGQFIPCKVTITPPVPPVIPPITATSIGLSDMSSEFPPQNAHSFFATVTVTASGGAYTGHLTLGGADAAKFTLSNGGVYPSNLHIGSNNIGVGTYHISITAP